MKFALTGGNGMLGRDLASAALKRGHEPIVLDLPEFDLCAIAAGRAWLPECDGVINCAAYTRVDDAETEREAAYRINADGAGQLAVACAQRGIPLIHISTDYVFNGRKGSPYIETDPTDPVNYYGHTKLAGERAVLAAGGYSTILRTQSLYGLQGRNFIKAILNQIRAGKKTLHVVSDQVSSPTYTAHLAEELIRLAEKPPAGLLHLAAAGQCSWFDFARAIVKAVGEDVMVEPKSSAELKYPAARPAFSVLDTRRFQALTGRQMPDWSAGLMAYLADEPLAKL